MLRGCFENRGFDLHGFTLMDSRDPVLHCHLYRSRLKSVQPEAFIGQPCSTVFQVQNRSETDDARSIGPAYQTTPAKLQHCQSRGTRPTARLPGRRRQHVPKEASEGSVKLPNPMRRKDAELDRHRMWVEHAAIIALATALRPIFCVHPQTEKF